MMFGHPLACLALLLGALGPPAPADDEVAVLEAVTITTTADGVTIRVDLTAPREGARHELTDPARIFFDFPATQVRAGASQTFPVDHKLLAAVRVGQFNQEPPIARVVLDLKSRQTVQTATEDGGRTLFVSLGGGGGRPAKPPAREPTLEVTGGRWTAEGAAEAAFALELSQFAEARTFRLSEPDRIVIDLAGAAWRGQVAQPRENNGLVRSVRVAQFTPDIVRCVLELKANAAFQLGRRLNPTRLEIRLFRGESRGRLVVIDPGHGGKDGGCTGYKPGLLEKHVVLDIGLRLAELLRKDGVTVQLTRADDTFVELTERAAIANRLRADLFVSIHANTLPEDKKGQRSGLEVYYYTDPSAPFAACLSSELAKVVKLPERGTFQRRFVVVRETVMPSALCEVGYLCHPGDGGKLATPEFRQLTALGLRNGVLRYLERLPGRLAATDPEAAPGAANPPKDS